jgi:uncharacterized membrane protein YbhN (UPF0104 family)
MATATLERPVVAPPAAAGVAARPDRVGHHHPRALTVLGSVLVMLVLATEAVLAGPYPGSAITALTQAADGWVGLALLATTGSLTAFGLVRRRLLRAAGIRVSVGASVAAILVANALHMTLPGGIAFSTG